MEGWGGSSVVESTCHFTREPKPGSQHPHQVAPNHLKQAPEDARSLSMGTLFLCTYPHIDADVCKFKIKILSFNYTYFVCWRAHTLYTCSGHRIILSFCHVGSDGRLSVTGLVGSTNLLSHLFDTILFHFYALFLQISLITSHFKNCKVKWANALVQACKVL